MPVTNTLPITQAIGNGFVQIVNATGNCGVNVSQDPSNLLTVYTAGANGSIIKSLLVASDEPSTARVLSFFINDGTHSWFLFSVSIPATAGKIGTSATPNVDVLGSAAVVGLPLDQAGKPILELKANYLLKVGSQTTVTSTQTVAVTALAEDF